MSDNHEVLKQLSEALGPQEVRERTRDAISELEMYPILRKQIEHEDELVNQRVNWLLF